MYRALALFLIVATGCPGGDDPTESGEVEGELLGILVSPEKVTIPVGGEIRLEATGLLAGRDTQDLTHVVEWTSSNPAIIEVSNALDSEGVVVAKALGAAVVTGSASGVESVDVPITVTDAELKGLSVSPSDVSIEVGETVQLEAQAAYSDGTRSDSTAQVRWITGDPDVVTVSRGKLTAAGVGKTTIRAEWEGLEAEAVNVEVLQSATPDLVISEVRGEGGPDNVTLTVAVTNTGNAGASEFWVDVYVDPTETPGPGVLGADFLGVNYLGPDETVEVGFNLPAAPGTREIVVLADTEDDVEESSESNNRFDTKVEVGSAGGPNLTVSYFDYIADATSIYYVVDIYNSGSEDVGEFYVDLYVHYEDYPVFGADGDEYVDVLGLAAGDSTYADFLIETYCEYCWSWIVIDSYDEIEETDETDNIAGPLEVEAD